MAYNVQTIFFLDPSSTSSSHLCTYIGTSNCNPSFSFRHQGTQIPQHLKLYNFIMAGTTLDIIPASLARDNPTFFEPYQHKLPSNASVILLFGLTGAGKTSYINRMTNSDLEVSDTITSGTLKVQFVNTLIGGKLVSLVDTPGFDDLERSVAEILLNNMNLHGAQTYRLNQEEEKDKAMAVALLRHEPTLLQIQLDNDVSMTEYGKATGREVKERIESSSQK